MRTVKVILNGKEKISKDIHCDSYESLIFKIRENFSVDKINIMKPRIRDEDSFQKEVKPGGEILISAILQKKQLTGEQLEKKKQQEVELREMQEDLLLNAHQKIVKQLQKKGIKERAIDYLNSDSNEPEDLGINYAVHPLYLFKASHELRNYSLKYQCMERNPDGLIIEELGAIFREMETAQNVVCPLDWISAWICYCSDDLCFPYPTYGIDYFLNRLFTTIKSAFDVELEKKQEEPNSRVDIGTKYFGIQHLTKREDKTKLDQDEEDPKQIDKKVMKYLLECDLGKPQLNTMIQGITERFKEKELWRNFYAFDIQYKERIISIERLPKYLFVHCSRWGYPSAREEWQEVEFFNTKKSSHRVRISRILDIYELCDHNLQLRLEQGRYERYQMFYPYDMDQNFFNFCDQLKSKMSAADYSELSEIELKYLYLDNLLNCRDIFHEFFFEPLKNSKPTGEYRLIGMVLHRGDYYHHPDQGHKHNCKGQFMTIVYKKGREWVKYYQANVEIIDVDVATSQEFWGKEGGWTPMLLMYKEINMKTVAIEPPRDLKKLKQERNKKAGKNIQAV